MQRNFTEIFLDQKTPNGPWLRLGGGCSEESSTHQGAPRGLGVGVVPTSGAPRTASLLYKYHNIPETLGESMKINSSHHRV